MKLARWFFIPLLFIYSGAIASPLTVQKLPPVVEIAWHSVLQVAISSGAPAVTWTPTANPAIIIGTSNPQTFSGLSSGTASINRVLAICVGLSTNGPPTAVTADSGGGPISATLDAVDSVSGRISLWHVSVPTGTTVNVLVTATLAFPTLAGVSVGALTTTTPTPSTIASEPFGFLADPQVTTTALTIPTNGMGVLCGGSTNPNAAPTFNNWLDDYHGQISGATWQNLLGHLIATGSQTPSISGYNFAGFTIAAASWGP